MAPKRPRPGLLAPRAHDQLSVDERVARLNAARGVVAVSEVAQVGITHGGTPRGAAGPYTAPGVGISGTIGPSPSGVRPSARRDVPISRNVRRGGAAQAAGQLELLGLSHLVEDLTRDREAASGQ